MPAKRYVFVASPYSHPCPDIRMERYEAACRASIWFVEFDVPAYVPIAMTGRFDAPQVPYERWVQHSKRMLHHSAAVVVLTLDGWDKSTGIAAEVELAKQLRLPVEYVEYPQLRDYLAANHQRLRKLCDTPPPGILTQDEMAAQSSSALDQFSTGAIRDSSLGRGRYELLPPNALKRWALRMELGAIRYGPNNYLRGIPLSRILNSAVRHAYMFLDGDDSEDHLGALIWNAGAAAEIETRCLRGQLPESLLDAGPANRRDWTIQDFSQEKPRYTNEAGEGT